MAGEEGVNQRAFEMAQEALIRINSHEKACEQKYVDTKEEFNALRLEVVGGHRDMKAGMDLLNKRMWDILKSISVGLILMVISLIVYIWTTHIR